MYAVKAMNVCTLKDSIIFTDVDRNNVRMKKGLLNREEEPTDITSQ